MPKVRVSVRARMLHMASLNATTFALTTTIALIVIITILLSTGMLFIDVLSVLPFWAMEFNPDWAGNGSLLRVPRLLRLIKLTKLLRGE